MKEIKIIQTDNLGFFISTKDSSNCYSINQDKDSYLKTGCKALWKIMEIFDLEDSVGGKKILLAMVGEDYEIPKDA